ncbi:uncharacterized protein LOC127878994 [Dreissena polymorpha]|nr:uncharacterized protein LOC127878994 [Dreissena polymorpha]
MTGDTPLHTALRTGAQEAMEGLLIKGAKPNIPNKDGYRPVDVGKNKEIRESLRMYSTLLIAMSAGYIMANGLKIRRTDLRDNLFLVERVGIIVRKFDFPVELPSVGFYCRREKAENTSIELPPYQEETVFSDIFHIRLFDAMRDCGATLYLPLYQCPSDKEEVVLRYLNSDIPDRPMSQYIEQNNEHFCEATLTLIPETTFVCLLYVRQKREVHTVGTEEFKFLSEMVEEFEMAIPQGTFQEDTSISLQVFETNTDDDKILDEEDFQDTSGPATDDPNTNLQDPAEDPNEDAISPTDSHMPVEDTASGAMQDKNDSVSLKDKVCDLTEDNPIVNADSSDIQHINNADAQVLEEDLDENSSVKQRSVSVNPDLLTDVYQINVGGKQPNGKVKLSLPFCQDLGSEDECVIVSTNENSLNENSIEVIQTSVIQGNLVFEVSHFSIFVATWKRKLKSETEVSDEIREQICNTRDKKKPASFFVAVRKISNTDDKHTLCGRLWTPQQSTGSVEKMGGSRLLASKPSKYWSYDDGTRRNFCRLY